MTELLQQHLDEYKGTVAVMHTNRGDITFKLFDDIAPKTVKNFIELAQKGYYDGVIFHRVIPEFMIQGGDPTGTGMGGESIYGQSFEDEFSKEVFNLRGALSMANAGPNTNGSQFFVVQAHNVPASMMTQLKDAGYSDDAMTAYQEMGGTPWLDYRHTVFGHVMDGMDVVDEIASVQRDSQDRPAFDIIIESIDIQ